MAGLVNCGEAIGRSLASTKSAPAGKLAASFRTVDSNQQALHLFAISNRLGRNGLAVMTVTMGCIGI